MKEIRRISVVCVKRAAVYIGQLLYLADSDVAELFFQQQRGQRFAQLPFGFSHAAVNFSSLLRDSWPDAPWRRGFAGAFLTVTTSASAALGAICSATLLLLPLLNLSQRPWILIHNTIIY